MTNSENNVWDILWLTEEQINELPKEELEKLQSEILSNPIFEIWLVWEYAKNRVLDIMDRAIDKFEQYFEDINKLPDLAKEKYRKLEDDLIKRKNEISQRKEIDIKKEAIVIAYSEFIERAQLSIIHDYIETVWNHRLQIQVNWWKFIKYWSLRVNFEWNEMFWVDDTSNALLKSIKVRNITNIVWNDAWWRQSSLYASIELFRRKWDILVATISKLLMMTRKQNDIYKIIDDFNDFISPENLLKWPIEKYDRVLRTAEKTGVESIDNEIEKMHWELVDKVQRKMNVLADARRVHEMQQEWDRIVTSASIMTRKKEVAEWMSFRYIKYDKTATNVELIPPSELWDKEKSNGDIYFQIPYYESNDPDRFIEQKDFVLTEYHWDILFNRMKALYHYPTRNTLLVWLAWTGKDYFIEYLSSLMNMENCLIQWKKLITIEDFFYTRRISKDWDYSVPTPAETFVSKSWCLLNLTEVNKFGPMLSDLNPLFEPATRKIFLEVKWQYFSIPAWNMIFWSMNPSWFWGWRSDLEFDVKDRFQNIFKYEYLPFFWDADMLEKWLAEQTPKINTWIAWDDKVVYYSYEGEIYDKSFPALEKMWQTMFRNTWNQIYNNWKYNSKIEKALQKHQKAEYRSISVLKNILEFVNVYRKIFEMARLDKVQLEPSEMLTQRTLKTFIEDTAMIDPLSKNPDTYKVVIKYILKGRIEDEEEWMPLIRQILNS